MKFYKVREAIKVKFGTLQKFADESNIKYPTLIRKLAGKNEFTRKEMVTFCELLDIPIERIWEYFFYA